MITGVEEAVVRGLSLSESMSDDQADLKLSWNAWALKLCEAEEGTPQLRGKCLLQRTVLLLAQNSFQKAIDSSGEVMRIQPANKHAAALNATALHKIGRKKEAASAVTELIGAIPRSEDVQDALGAPRAGRVAAGGDAPDQGGAPPPLAASLARDRPAPPSPLL